MKIIAVTNIKGGVGKTTTAVNLAYLYAADGRRTVLWDLDAQGAATYTLHVDPRERVPARRLVAGERELSEFVQPTRYPNLDLIAADLSYRNFDLRLAERKRPVERLLRMSRPLRELHDVLVIDCPPGISLLSESVLHAADGVVVPLLPSPLSVRMLEQLREFIAAEGWSDLQLLPFFSMVDRRKSLHAETIEATRAQFPEMLPTEVPYWSEIERMTVRRAPLPAAAPQSAATRIYAALWADIRVRMQWPERPAPEPAVAPNVTGVDAESVARLPEDRGSPPPSTPLH